MTWKKTYVTAGAIIIASVILGGFYYETQTQKQQSIENRQEREYIGQRKQECLEIYKVESEQWHNVNSWSYRPPSSNIFDVGYADKCVVQYRNDDGSVFEKDF